jgi:uncharacterized protein YbjT (DUF2867 family)
MRVFLTGASGFIGGAVASALIAQGHSVRGLVRNKAKAEAVAAHGVEPVLGSLDDAALLHPKPARRMRWSMPPAATIAARSRR